MYYVYVLSYALLFNISIIRLIVITHFKCWVVLSGWRWGMKTPAALAQLSVRHHIMGTLAPRAPIIGASTPDTWKKKIGIICYRTICGET